MILKCLLSAVLEGEALGKGLPGQLPVPQPCSSSAVLLIAWSRLSILIFHLQSFPAAGCSKILAASPRKRASCQRPLSLVCLSKDESGIWLVLACYFDSTSLPFALLGSVSTSGLGQKSGKWPICRKKKKESTALSQVFCHLASRRAEDSQLSFRHSAGQAWASFSSQITCAAAV